jgi:DNA-binding IclR family transcriptional regulator
MVNIEVHKLNKPRLPGQQSVWRAVDVLFCFDAEHPSLTAAEVGEQLGMNRTTAWRYLQTLAGTGLVRELGDGRFGLGARTLSLAGSYTSQWAELEAVAGAALLRLRDAVGETAALHLRQGWNRVVVRQLESRHELHRTYRDVGVPISLLVGAPSRAILAELPATELEVYLDVHVPRHAAAPPLDPPLGPSPDRPLDRGHVEQELAQIRADGFAVSRGSRVANVASVAAAIRDRQGQVLGAVNVTGPADRLPDQEVPQIAAEVTRAARWIESQLVDSDQADPAPRV